MSEPVIQREKIIAVIEAERKLVDGFLVEQCANPGHCAIGALLAAEGFGFADYESRTGTFLSAFPDNWEFDSEPAVIIKNAYGLTRAAAALIVDANDSGSGGPRRRITKKEIAERRAAVIAKVNELADAQAARLSAEVTP